MDIKAICKKAYPRNLKKKFKEIPDDKKIIWLQEEALLNIKSGKEIGLLKILL